METKSGAAVRDFVVGDTIMVRDYRPTAKARWTQGVVEVKYGSKTYLVRVECGGLWKRHADQIVKDLREQPQAKP